MKGHLGQMMNGDSRCVTISLMWHANAVRSSSSTVGVGIIIRDSLRLVAAVMETTILCCGDMLQIHVEACQLGIKFAFDMGFRRLEVDLGCLDFLRLIQQGPPCLSHIGVLVDDLCGWVPKFSDLIQKSCNKTALVLTTEAVSSISLQVWLEDQPDCISLLVQADVL